MNTQQQIEEIRKACIAVNEDIAELKFGCKVKTKLDGVITCIHDPYIGDFYGAIKKGRVWSFQKEDIVEIIGRDIRLSDILAVIVSKQNNPEKEGYIWKVTDKTLKLLSMYDLLNDTVQLQSPETINFIHELIV